MSSAKPTENPAADSTATPTTGPAAENTDADTSSADGLLPPIPLVTLPSPSPRAERAVRSALGLATPVQPEPPAAGRRVLVTGGASGLGRALTEAFLAAGDRVLVGDLAPASARPAGVPVGAEYVHLDVTSEADWRAVRDVVEQRWGGLDVLVNNAGIAQGGGIDKLTDADWSRIVDVNLLGVTRGCRTFAPVLRAQGHGRIVNIASAAGLVHPPGMSSYNSVKAGVVALSETLRWELGPSGVAVSVVCPTFFRTDLASSLNTSDPALAATARSLIDGAKRGPEEIVAAVLPALEAGRFLVLPDLDARLAYLGKHFLPPLYAKGMADAGRKMARRALRTPK